MAEYDTDDVDAMRDAVAKMELAGADGFDALRDAVAEMEIAGAETELADADDVGGHVKVAVMELYSVDEIPDLRAAAMVRRSADAGGIEGPRAAAAAIRAADAAAETVGLKLYRGDGDRTIVHVDVPPAAKRRNVVYVVDVSSSMALDADCENVCSRLDLARAFLELAVRVAATSELTRVAIVACGRAVRIALPLGYVTDPQNMEAAIAKICGLHADAVDADEADGRGADTLAGIATAYDNILIWVEPAEHRHVVLVTDGCGAPQGGIASERDQMRRAGVPLHYVRCAPLREQLYLMLNPDTTFHAGSLADSVYLHGILCSGVKCGQLFVTVDSRTYGVRTFGVRIGGGTGTRVGSVCYEIEASPGDAVAATLWRDWRDARDRGEPTATASAVAGTLPLTPVGVSMVRGAAWADWGKEEARILAAARMCRLTWDP